MAVLIKGKSIKCSQTSRDHYLRGKENERVTVREVIGFATKDADEALQMIELSVKGTKCHKPLYSAKINPEPDRVWTKQEVLRAIQTLETNLGLTGHPRITVEHLKHGRIHYHVLWSRFHPDGGSAKNMGNDYAIHQKTQRQLEKEFNLKPMQAKGRDFKHWEVEYAKRYGFDIFQLREQITQDFITLKTGQEFKQALQAKRVVLCRGDKSQFVLILPWGQHKALSSMVYGRPTKAVLRRALVDIDIKTLPTVEEGKRHVKATLPKVKKQPRGKALKTGGWPLRPKHTYVSKNSVLTALQQSQINLIKPQQTTGAGDIQISAPTLSRKPVVVAPSVKQAQEQQAEPVRPVVHSKSGPAQMWEEYPIYKAQGRLREWWERWKEYLGPLPFGI